VDILKDIRTLDTEHDLEDAALKRLIETDDPEADQLLTDLARRTARSVFGNQIYTRGLIEFTNVCKNDCYYCGLRASNSTIERYRLSEEEIMSCCHEGLQLGFRTFVLQGGEDPQYSDDDICAIVSRIKKELPQCAVTLSIGEKSREAYQAYFDSGADRYLLRHETANAEHYARLHPGEMSLENRKRCLYDLRDIGYQVGCGIMVGSPWQTTENLIEDLRFMQDLQPHMIGIGPFIPCENTPFENREGGTLQATLRMLGVLRLMFPEVLLPATTALGTIDPTGREKGIMTGANVVMPNLSPPAVRKKYLLYDDKICTGEEAAECRHCLSGRMDMIGYELAVSRGDHPSRAREEQGA
jgi:biotin synthase